MGQILHEERYEDIILHALLPEYEKVRTASYERRGFRLNHIRHMVHTMCVDNLSSSSNSKPVSCCVIAMRVVGNDSSDVKCHYCKGIGRVMRRPKGGGAPACAQ